jgi:hypothetical protein
VVTAAQVEQGLLIEDWMRTKTFCSREIKTYSFSRLTRAHLNTEFKQLSVFKHASFPDLNLPF